MRYFIVSIIFLGACGGFVAPAFAQAEKAQAVELHERLTPEQAQVLAVEAVPGQPLKMVEKYAGEEMYYSFMIGTADGSIYEVPVHSQRGEIAEIMVEGLAKRPKAIPFELVPGDAARATVKAYLIENAPGKRPPFMKDGKLVVHERKLAYQFKSKKSGHWYTVLVDARSGEVISMEGNAP